MAQKGQMPPPKQGGNYQPPQDQNTQKGDIDPYFNSLWVFHTRFDIPKRYILERPIGNGGYGIVLKGKDSTTGELVAIKKILRPFVNLLETKRILREIRILKALKHDNVISLRDILNPCSKENFKEIYIVFGLMASDLHQIIASGQELSEDHIQYFMYQLLCGVKYIHSANIFHRDLKPSNLLVNEDCELKICDFGLSRSTEQSNFLMTEYVATRWYRAPELFLQSKKYTTAVDMWSVGCILAELIGRRPLFPGDNYLHQLNIILGTIGSPSEKDLDEIPSEKAKQYLRALKFKPARKFSEVFPGTNPLMTDLLDRLLIFNPNKRMTAEEALDHPFFESIRDKSCETTADSDPNFDFENENFTDNVKLKEMIFDEMKTFHPDLDENDPNTYHHPTTKAENMLTLDTDGSLIYIDFSKHKNNWLAIAQSMFAVPNVPKKQAQDTLELLDLNENETLETELDKIKKEESNKGDPAKISKKERKIEESKEDFTEDDGMFAPPVQKFLKKE